MSEQFATGNTGTHYGISTTSLTGTTLSGSLISLEQKRNINTKEFTINGDFVLVALNKRTDEVTFDIIVTTTGNSTSASFATVEPGSTLTINSTTNTSATGSYRITDIASKEAEEELCHITGTAKRWKQADGTYIY